MNILQSFSKKESNNNNNNNNNSDNSLNQIRLRKSSTADRIAMKQSVIMHFQAFSNAFLVSNHARSHSTHDYKRHRKPQYPSS
jgi:hypothetical protein